MWNPELTQARLSLGLVKPEEYAPLAWAALEADLDGPTIRRVAALTSPSGYETDQLRRRFMEEAGLQELGPEDAWARIAGQRAREVLASGKDPRGFLHEFFRMWVDSGYTRALQDLGALEDHVYLADEYGGGMRYTVVEIIREAAAPRFR